MKYRNRSKVNNISYLRKNTRLISSSYIQRESYFYSKFESTSFERQHGSKFVHHRQGLLPFDEKSFEALNNELSNLNITPGGSYTPTECQPKYKIAIIVPYRNREDNLKLFLKNIHPFLIKQKLEYSIFLIEPIQSIKFNRGLLLNIGFLESIQLGQDKWNCFVFHDVDLIPENEKNLYYCPALPKHMSSAVSTFDYRLPYKGLFGGVSILKKTHMQRINGFSNMYFGWGGEDDDLRKRNNLETGRYRMLKHKKDSPNPKRFKLLKSSIKRSNIDGLNSIRYVLISVNFEPLFTKIVVSYDESLYTRSKANY
ncbi:beta-1-4-N-acetylgalactosaminyltransferase bre-4 [Brachionus plicatilis]|uniref:Beta-1,4-galactosyltransferase n=1 Tax=Brachionus plicatilis TaxID=10195 RepID=A0A3M7SS47_BRAPC|nr:beta-1-4-N-acetylgalactosaminyltransferase bre-4 [Brachionus plicatilis]